MKTKARDRELINAMRRYFVAKAELSALRAVLEQARRATGEDIGGFYDPRTNVAHADQIRRSHALNAEMRLLMDRAAAWGRLEVAELEKGHAPEEPETALPPAGNPAGSSTA